MEFVGLLIFGTYSLMFLIFIFPPISIFLWISGLFKKCKNRRKYALSNVIFMVAVVGSCAFYYAVSYTKQGLLLGWFIGLAAFVSNVLFYLHIQLHVLAFKDVKQACEDEE